MTGRRTGSGTGSGGRPYHVGLPLPLSQFGILRGPQDGRPMSSCCHLTAAIRSSYLHAEGGDVQLELLLVAAAAAAAVLEEIIGDATRAEDGSDVRRCQTEGGGHGRFPLLHVLGLLIVGLLVIAVEQAHPASALASAATSAPTSAHAPRRYIVPAPSKLITVQVPSTNITGQYLPIFITKLTQSWEWEGTQGNDALLNIKYYIKYDIKLHRSIRWIDPSVTWMSLLGSMRPNSSISRARTPIIE